jgi:hypothetical protein
MWQVCKRTEIYSGFWKGDLTKGDYTMDLKDTVWNGINWADRAQYIEK